MPTSRATWRSDSAPRPVSSLSRRAASRIARRVRSFFSPLVGTRASVTGTA